MHHHIQAGLLLTRCSHINAQTTSPGFFLLIVIPAWPFVRLLQSPQSACSTPIALKSSNECIGEIEQGGERECMCVYVCTGMNVWVCAAPDISSRLRADTQRKRERGKE